MADDREVKSDLARDINNRILDALPSDSIDRPLDFFCECGCMKRVVMSKLEYVSAGRALVQGHKPPKPNRTRDKS
ncbi:MAG TPA: hypothetical protein VGN06_10340 [Gaiellaceae bacterium]